MAGTVKAEAVKVVKIMVVKIMEMEVARAAAARGEETGATLCMPGYPPRHVCAADRRFLLTYLNTTGSRPSCAALTPSRAPLNPRLLERGLFSLARVR